MYELYKEYDDIIIGERSKFSEIYFVKNPEEGMNNALKVMRYAFIKYLKWTPDSVKENISEDIMKKMHLAQLMKYVVYPPEHSKRTDWKYLACLMFDNKNLSFRDKTLNTYIDVLESDPGRYPKNFFLGSDGMVRAGICLQYMISNYMAFSSINELYYTFATEEGYAALKKYKLLKAYQEIFDTPIDYLHFILPSSQKNDFYFFYYKYKYYKEMMTGVRKRKNKTEYLLKGNLA